VHGLLDALPDLVWSWAFAANGGQQTEDHQNDSDLRACSALAGYRRADCLQQQHRYPVQRRPLHSDEGHLRSLHRLLTARDSLLLLQKGSRGQP